MFIICMAHTVPQFKPNPIRRTHDILSQSSELPFTKWVILQTHLS